MVLTHYLLTCPATYPGGTFYEIEKERIWAEERRRKNKERYLRVEFRIQYSQEIDICNCFSINISSDGRLAIIGCADNTLQVWNLITNNQIAVVYTGETE